MNVQVLGALDAVQLAELTALLTRCERADHHPALAEPQREAAARPDLGGHGARVVLAYEDGDDLVGCAFVTPALDGATALHVAIDPERMRVSLRTPDWSTGIIGWLGRLL